MAKNHLEVYKEIQEGAITYFNEVKSDDLITEYGKSKNINTAQTIKVLITQGNEKRVEFVNSLKEFEELRAKVEQDVKAEKKDEKSEVKEYIKENGDSEIVISNSNENESEKDIGDSKSSDSDNDTENNENDRNDKSGIDAEIEELKEKQKTMEKMGELLLSSLDSISKLKNSLMQDSLKAGILLEARMELENAKDKMAYRTAQNMVAKNILVARREIIVLEINKAIAKGENLDSLQNELIEVNNQVDGLDRTFENEFKVLQNEVSGAHLALQNASKEVIKSVKVDFRNSYKKIENYNGDGILKSETVDINKNLNRIAMQTNYDDNILASGKSASISTQTININGNVVRVLSKESVNGINTSFMDGNTVQMETGIGKNNQYVTRDGDGDLIADSPELEDSLKRIGINSIEDIGEICDEMDEKAEMGDAEEIDNDDGEMQPPLNRYTE